jgi:hypothetical protein
MTGMPLSTHWSAHRLAQGHLANWLGHFLLDGNLGQGCLLLGTCSVTLPLSLSLIPSLSLSLSLLSFPLPRVRAQQLLQLTLTKQQLDNSALFA